MNELGWIEQQLREAYEGEPWHGPSLRSILKDVTADQAAFRPLALGHSMWELVLHVIAWEEVVRRRMSGETVAGLSAEQDFPIVEDTSEAAWRSTLERLHQKNTQLRLAIRVFPEDKLQEIVPARKHSFRTMLHGSVQHQAYHAGQIALLKRAVNARG
jgi:uncharacterized damage-inducible protein DinB